MNRFEMTFSYAKIITARESVKAIPGLITGLNDKDDNSKIVYKATKILQELVCQSDLNEVLPTLKEEGMELLRKIDESINEKFTSLEDDAFVRHASNQYRMKKHNNFYAECVEDIYDFIEDTRLEFIKATNP